MNIVICFFACMHRSDMPSHCLSYLGGVALCKLECTHAHTHTASSVATYPCGCANKSVFVQARDDGLTPDLGGLEESAQSAVFKTNRDGQLGSLCFHLLKI